MFRVNEEDGTVTLNAGDTGSWFIDGSRDDEVPFTAADRAVFTVKDSQGEIVLERVFGLADADLGNGTIFIMLDNDDTDDWTPGTYTYEVRYVVNPYYDEDGKIISGDIVWTPGIDGEGNPIGMTVKPVQKYI